MTMWSASHSAIDPALPLGMTLYIVMSSEIGRLVIPLNELMLDQVFLLRAWRVHFITRFSS